MLRDLERPLSCDHFFDRTTRKIRRHRRGVRRIASRSAAAIVTSIVTIAKTKDDEVGSRTKAAETGREMRGDEASTDGELRRASRDEEVKGDGQIYGRGSTETSITDNSRIIEIMTATICQEDTEIGDGGETKSRLLHLEAE